MVPSYISPEDATLLLLNRVCFASDFWCVLDVYVSLCEWRMRQRDSNCARQSRVLHDHSPPFSHSSPDASLPYCPA